MARRTLSGAPSSKSDKCTCTRPSRNRIVVFRLVKRRKRTSRKGMGARGRRARYSSANNECNSEFTAFQPSRTWRRKPSPFLFLLFSFLFSFLGFLLLLSDVFCLVVEHLSSRLMRALIRIESRFAGKVILAAGFWLVQYRCPFRCLFDDLLEHFAQIGVLLVKVVHVVLEVVAEPRKLLEQVVNPHALVLRNGVGVDAVDVFGSLVDVADEQPDPRQRLISGLTDFFDLLFG